MVDRRPESEDIYDRHINGRVNLTDATAADVIAAQAGKRLVVTSYSIENSHATVSTKVELRDGTVVKVRSHAQAAGGGSTRSGDPIFISTVEMAITARCVSSGADVEVNVSGYTI